MRSHAFLLLSCLAFTACTTDSGDGDSGGGQGPTTDEYVRADITLGDGSVVSLDAFSMFESSSCQSIVDLEDDTTPEARFVIHVRWDASTPPDLGQHATGDAQGVDLWLFGGGQGENIGPENPPLKRHGSVTFTEFGSVVAGTFEAVTDNTGDNMIVSVANGTFRCVQ